MLLLVQRYFIILAIAFSVLQPVINIPTPLFLKSLDFFAYILFFSFTILVIVHKKIVDKNLVFVLSSILILLLQMLALELIFLSSDFDGIKILTRSIATVLAAYGCSLLLFQYWGENATSCLVKVIIVCALIQGGVLWLSFLMPDFKEFMAMVFYRDQSKPEHLLLQRVAGFNVSGGDGLSLNHGLLCVIGLLGAYKVYSPSSKRRILILLLFLSVIGATFTGRSGLYLGFSLMFFIYCTEKNGMIVFRRSVRFFFGLLLFITVLFLFAKEIGQFGQSLVSEYGYENPIVRLLRGFIAFHNSGIYQDSTLRNLTSDMVKIPSDYVRFIIGNNSFGRGGAENLSTDVGYFRMWHGFGAVGLIILLTGIYVAPILFLRNRLTRACNDSSRNLDKLLVTFMFHLSLIILVFGLVAHYKIFFLTTRVYMFLYFVVIFLSFRFLRKYKPVNF